jgi:hypothetical protein
VLFKPERLAARKMRLGMGRILTRPLFQDAVGRNDFL